MPTTIAVAPVTRIEGHLDIEATFEAAGAVRKVVDARTSGTMFRGFELLLKGRHPRDAIHITQRICGVCPTSHAVAASMALEAACGPEAVPPPNGRILRNLLLGADFLQSHILHFYQLTLLDYVDTTGVLDASPWTPRPNAPDLITGRDAASLLGHYVKAMEIRRKVQQLGAVFGGRMPCSPVFVAGGCRAQLTDKVDMATMGEPTASERIQQCQRLLDEIRTFIDTTYLVDVQILLDRFPAYLEIGRGCARFLSFGAFDLDTAGSKRLLERGVWTSREPGPLDADCIQEHVRHSRYRSAGGPLGPSAGVTKPDPEKPDAYSWIKAPRYAQEACEVGPLARMWIAGLYRRGISVMDRLMARAQETKRIAGAMADWLGQLSIDGPTRARFKYPRTGGGAALTEAPRGALGHWLQFSNSAIRRYQVLAPTAWNASPMDDIGQKGPIEQALIGTPVRDPKQPIELLRVVHSFDPCLACSVH